MDGMKTGKRQRGAASLNVGYSQAIPAHMRGKVLEVSHVHTDEVHRGKGQATQLLMDVCDEADTDDVVLMLMPNGEAWLVDWYEKFGFVEIQEYPLLMARPPYKELH